MSASRRTAPPQARSTGRRSTFVLPSIAVYRVAFSVPVEEAGQLVLTLNGSELPYTVTGRATGTSAIAGEALVRTTAPSIRF